MHPPGRRAKSIARQCILGGGLGSGIKSERDAAEPPSAVVGAARRIMRLTPARAPRPRSPLNESARCTCHLNKSFVTCNRNAPLNCLYASPRVAVRPRRPDRANFSARRGGPAGISRRRVSGWSISGASRTNRPAFDGPPPGVIGEMNGPTGAILPTSPLKSPALNFGGEASLLAVFRRRRARLRPLCACVAFEL